MGEITFELPAPESCLFCDRIESGDRYDFIEEDEITITRVSGLQFQEGQVVVIPRRHAPIIFDLTDREAQAITLAARRVGEAVTRAFAADGLLLYQNNGKASGQDVPHYHLHVVPQQFETSPWGNGPRHIAAAEGRDFIPNRPTRLSEAQCTAMAEKIRGCLP